MQEGHAVANVDGNSRQLNRGYCHSWRNHSRKDGFYEEVVIWPYPALPEENGLVFRDVVAGLIIDKASQPLTITQGIFRDGVNTLSFRSRRKDGYFLATLSISIYRNPGEPTNTFDATRDFSPSLDDVFLQRQIDMDQGPNILGHGAASHGCTCYSDLQQHVGQVLPADYVRSGTVRLEIAPGPRLPEWNYNAN